jgi:DNA-binding NarL/FixJ family response regulator
VGPEAELLLVSPSDTEALAELLHDAAPKLRVRRVRRLNGRASTASAVLVVVHELAANPAQRWLDAVDGVPTMIITEQPSVSSALAAIDQGIDGYIPADSSVETLRATIAALLRGEIAYSRATLGAWLRSLRPETRREQTGNLTPRQSQIVELIATGATDKEIAAAIGVRTATAQKHVARLLRRLGVRNRAAAVAAYRSRHRGPS